MGLKWKLGVVSVVIFLFFASPVVAAVDAGDISSKIICQCGCTMVLSTCECDTAEAMNAVLLQKIDEGQSEKQILRYFVAQYGETVLAEPLKEGFNLVAWILPFATIAAGGWVVYIALRKWVRQGKRVRPVPVSGTRITQKDEEYEQRLEKELEEFSGGSFR